MSNTFFIVFHSLLWRRPFEHTVKENTRTLTHAHLLALFCIRLWTRHLKPFVTAHFSTPFVFIAFAFDYFLCLFHSAAVSHSLLICSVIYWEVFFCFFSLQRRRIKFILLLCVQTIVFGLLQRFFLSLVHIFLHVRLFELLLHTEDIHR